MAQRGRPIDSVWKFFIKVEDGGRIRAKCIKCSAMISAKAGRLRTHLEKCSQSQLQDNFPKDDLPEISVPFNSSDTKIPPEKRFNLAENDVFKKTISMLRPGYTPTRKSLAGGLLDKTFNEVTTITASALEGKDVTLVQDGWSDIHNSPVIAHCVHSRERFYFLNSVDTGSYKKTATYCTSLAIEASKEATDKFGCKVVAVVADNEQKTQSMRSKLKLLDSSLSVYDCASHLLNLLGKDITPSQIISHIIEINKYFRNHHNPGALLSAQKRSL
ncbi:hypothetical protein LOD99_12462 [Oopsacas minuta]|uniref:BED-type domain-containing protein n=1 Tax=Oopsacas minuta TaxID=111878 RepID=A0AAV7JFN4_9METZ|nr:hypothetical protein LOD99_12462 [Oopsacas minuta]